jgi:hypothetical protein
MSENMNVLPVAPAVPVLPATNTTTEFWSTASGLLAREFEANKHQMKHWFHTQGLQVLPLWYAHMEGKLFYFWKELLKVWPRLSKEKRARWGKGLIETMRGHSPLSYDVACFPFGFDDIQTTSWNVKVCHHAMMIDHLGELTTTWDHIIEIGGGLGELSRFCYDIGYTGRYTILDLPEVAKVSRAYLGKDYPQVQIVTDLADIHREPDEKTLVVGTWSMNEIPF